MLLAYFPNPLQQDRGGLVVAALLRGEFGFGGDKFTAERPSQDGLRQPLGPNCRRFHVALDPIREGEEGLDATDNLALLIKRGGGGTL